MSEFGATKEEVDKKTEDAEDEGGDDNAAGVEEECAATFTQIVKLEAVETKTNEEDEDVIYVQKAKLFAFTEAMLDKGTGKKQWNEKGVGEMKMLKHKENSKIRILMRQEKTLKILANHYLDPRLKLEPSVGNDKSLVWNAFDYSDGKTVVDTTFAIRFKTAEIAVEFKTSFLNAQKDNVALAAGADSKEGAAEADAAADAIAGLSVSNAEKVASPEKIAPAESTPSVDSTQT